MLRPISACVTAALTLMLAGREPASIANAAAATPGCDAGAPQPAEVLQLLPQARRAQFAKIPLRVAMAELDGAAPREAVAFADDVISLEEWRNTEDESRARFGPDRESVLWVFGCKPQGWQLLAEKRYLLDEYGSDESETDGAPGFKVVKAERLLPDRDLLRVEWLDFRDGHSPFFTYRAFDLYTLRNDELSRVLICSTLNEYRSGPERSGRNTTRSIQFLKDKLPARVRIAMRSQWSSGVEPDDPADRPPGWDQPRDEQPASESRTAIYRFDGTRFVTGRPLCDEGLGDREDR